jgi:hypothetical protein
VSAALTNGGRSAQGRAGFGWSEGPGWISALIYDGDVGAAWDAAAGVASDRQWLTLADLIGSDRPADALPVYLRAIEPLRSQTGDPVYQQVAVLLSKIQYCHQQLGTAPEFVAYLVALRADQKRKRNLIKLLDQSGLEGRSQSRSPVQRSNRDGSEWAPPVGTQNVGTHADRWIAAGRSPLAAARDAAGHGWRATPVVRPTACGSPGMRPAPRTARIYRTRSTVKAVDRAECYLSWPRRVEGIPHPRRPRDPGKPDDRVRLPAPPSSREADRRSPLASVPGHPNGPGRTVAEAGRHRAGLRDEGPPEMSAQCSAAASMSTRSGCARPPRGGPRWWPAASFRLYRGAQTRPPDRDGDGLACGISEGQVGAIGNCAGDGPALVLPEADPG